MAGVKIAEAFVEFVARRARKFDETVAEVKKKSAEAAKGATQTAQAAAKTAGPAKTAQQAWDEMLGSAAKATEATTGAAAATAAGIGKIAPVAAGAAAALGPVAVGLGAVWVGIKLIGQMLPTLHAAADEAKRLRVTADVLGYTAAELTATAFALEHAGSSLEEFIGLRSEWNSQILDLQYGTGRATAALRILGVRATDETGRLRDLADVLPEISKGMKGLGGSDKQRLAEAIFGGSSSEFLKMLAQGEDSMKQMKLDARALGLQTNEATINAGAQVSDVWGALGDEIKALWKNVVAALSPAIIPLLTVLISLLGMINFVLSIVNATIVRPLTALFAQIYRVFQFVNRVVNNMHERFGWMKKLAEFFFGAQSKKGDSASGLGNASLQALSGGYAARLTTGLEFANSLVLAAVGRIDIAERQLAEQQKQTALLGVIAGSSPGETAPVGYGV